MKSETRYRYEKRIKSLQDEVNDLRAYRNEAVNIFNGLVEVSKEGTSVSLSWLLGRFRYLLK